MDSRKLLIRADANVEIGTGHVMRCLALAQAWQDRGADVVVNQNISAKESLYTSREKYTRLCLGLDYVLLRREFKVWRDWKREIAPVAKKILVTMGGSDPENVTSAVLRAMRLVDIDGVEFIVVVGPGNPNGEMLEQEAAGSNGLTRLCRNVTNIPELLSWADFAVSPPASSS